MNRPLVSIIIPTYNRPEYLNEAIESVVSQSYERIEVLVIDDGSKLTYAEEICNSFKKCTYFQKKNGGVSSARNYGVLKAKGDYIAFLDDDDFWREDKLEKQVAILLNNPKIDLVHSAAKVVDIKGKPTGKIIGASDHKASQRSGYVFWNALGRWLVKAPTPLMRKNVFSQDLMFDESLEVGEDTDFYQRLFYRHRVYYVNDTLAFYRHDRDTNGLSRQKKKYIGVEWNIYQNLKKMGVRSPIVLYRIARRLLEKAIIGYNMQYPNKSIEKYALMNIFNPVKGLKKIAQLGRKSES
jgi:glycosyltransferase involved in cell wall biosynthesis